MSSYIPLPKIHSAPGSKAHPYPYKIGMQVEKLIQGAMFYSSFVDVVVGEYLHTVPNAYEKIKLKFTNQGMKEQTWDVSWQCLENYMELLPNPVFQYSLYSMVIHWDWFISRLGSFVHFARSHDENPPIKQKDEKTLQRLSFVKVEDIFPLLENSTGLNFNIDPPVLSLFSEMLLVRNLGMHNEWEVDQVYINQTKTTGWKLGQQRLFTSAELEEWQRAMLKIIGILVFKIAQRYVNIPAFS